MSIKILVVDDSATDRLIIKSMLDDYDVTTASDGIEALDILRKNQELNLLILDLNMPNMNGFEVLEELKKDEKFKRVRTIILTNYDEIESEIKGLKLGAIDYVRKPIHIESLRTRIDVHAALLHLQHTLTQQLDEKTVSLDVLLKRAPIGIAISNINDPGHSEKRVIRVNEMFEKITGRTEKDIAKNGWGSLTHPEDLDAELELFKQLKAGVINNYKIEKRIIKSNGDIVWVDMTVASLGRNENDFYNYICLLQDVTTRKELELQREYLNTHDERTGLHNRRHFVSLFKRALESRKHYKIALLGVNLSSVHVLAVNYGYMYTQKLVKHASEVLNELTNKNIKLFLTHENRFIFFITDYHDKQELFDFAEKIANAMETVFKTDRISGGIGILEIEESDYELEMDMILRKLLIASEQSISLFSKDFEISYYDSEIDTKVNRERIIRDALNNILSGGTEDELYLHFQPILDLKTNSICGFEALTRLRTEKLGIVPPLEFISIAEETKLIIPIGELINQKALNFLHKLNEQGYKNISVTINTSAIQLYSPDFVRKILELIINMDVNPKNVGIEITESVFANDYDYINSHLIMLKQAGIQIYIDDFGTGYSSLARESELKMDFLKIDKYFIDKLCTHDHGQCITSDIISMAHKLGHLTVAEGVEKESQLQYLKEHNCDRIQGYVFSKPLSEDDAFKLLLEEKNQR